MSASADDGTLRRLLGSAFHVNQKDVERAIGHIENAGTPSGVITPEFAGQICHDTTNDDFYIAFDTSANTDWLVLAQAGISQAEMAVLETLTATAAEINAAADVSSRLVSIPDATTYTVLAANSGKPHVLPNLTADITITLPAVAAGLEYRFIYGGVAADAQDWIIDTGAGANFYLGGLVHLDTDADAAGDEVVMIAGNGSSNAILTVLTPQPGTEVYMVCNGTNWILSGRAVSITVPTFTDT